MIITETQRLLLRELTEDDAAFMLRLVNEPSWLEYIGDRKVYNLEDAKQYLLNGSIRNYKALGYGFWKVDLMRSGESIGVAGLAKRDYLEEVDLGFAFYPEFTGQGYAYEAAEAVVQYAKEKLGIRKLVAFTTKENQSSIRLLTKLGFQASGNLMLEGEELNLYSKMIS